MADYISREMFKGIYSLSLEDMQLSLIHIWIARRFETKGMFKPEQFIEYLDVMDEQMGDEGEGALDTEDSDAIKIMTIHGAKGLELSLIHISGIRCLNARGRVYAATMVPGWQKKGCRQ